MAENKKKKERPEAAIVAVKWAVPVVLSAIALFIAFCFIAQEQTAHLGVIVAGTLRGLFSFGGYLIPVLLIVHAIFFASDIDNKRLIPRIILSILLLTGTSMLIHTVWFWEVEITELNAALLYKDGTNSIGGGFIGGALAFVLKFCVGRVGIIIFFATVVLLYAVFFITKNKNPLAAIFNAVLYAFVRTAAKIEKRIKNKIAEKKTAKKLRAEQRKLAQDQKKTRKIQKKAEARMEKESELYEDDFFQVDNGLKEFKIDDLGIKETRSDADLEMNPSFQDKVFHPSRVEEEGSHRVNRKPFNADYGMDFQSDTASAAGKSTWKYNYGISPDDSADTVFSEDFDEFDCEANVRFVSMKSSAPEVDLEKTEKQFERRAFSESDIAAARRRADFEYRKNELKKITEIQEQRQQAEAHFTPTSFEFDINPEKAPIDDVYNSYTASNEPYQISNEDVSFKNGEYSAFEANSYKHEVEYSSIINDQDAERAAAERAAAERAAAERAAAERAAAERAAAERAAAERAAAERAAAERAAAERAAAERAAAERAAAEKAAAEKAAAEIQGEEIYSYEESRDDNYTNAFDLETDEEDRFFTGDEDKPTINIGALLDDNYGDDEDVFTFTDDEEEEIPLENQNPAISEYQKMFSIFEKEEKDDDSNYAANATFDNDEEEEAHNDNRPLFTYGEDIDEVGTPVTDKNSVPFDFDTYKEEAEEVKDEPQKPDYSNFQFPPIDMLKKGFEAEDPTIAEEIEENGEKLIDALAQFDVRASIKSVDRGPRITRYEIVPARGVRVSKVIGLFDDIALNLAAEGIRMEAPIPGKSAIGVEIPNKHPSTVFLRDLLESDEFVNESSKTFACFGKDVTGNPVFGDIAKMPHMLVAGATGMGKSVCINSILISILYRARPDEVKFIMIDPKTVEFTMYNGIPHLLVPVVTDAKQAAGALMWAIDEMNRRYELMAKHEVRKLDSYNDLVRENPSLGEVLPKIIIVIDELNDLMQQVRRPVEGLITNITQKARAAGIHMIIGTQRPSVDVITGVIKANVPSRVSCKVTSFTDSKTILDQAGAEKLLDKGDMLFAPVGKPKPIRVQGAFVSDSEVEKIMKFLKSNVKGNIYDERALEDMIRAAQKCNKGKDAVDGIDEDERSEEGAGYLNDKQFLEAVDLAIKQGKISTSLIQRKISVGYGKAAKFIDIMEEMGLVSEPNGSKPRDVLVTRDEWHEMLSRRSLDD